MQNALQKNGQRDAVLLALKIGTKWGINQAIKAGKGKKIDCTLNKASVDESWGDEVLQTPWFYPIETGIGLTAYKNYKIINLFCISKLNM